MITRHKQAVYVEGSMEVPVKYFINWLLELQFKTASNNSVWINPAPFCVIRKINDARYTKKAFSSLTNEKQEANPETYLQEMYNSGIHTDVIS